MRDERNDDAAAVAAQDDERENWATPHDYAGVLAAILHRGVASDVSCEKMIAMLETQQCTRRISRYLPAGEGIRWGSKTGSINGVTNDVGFIATDDGTLIGRFTDWSRAIASAREHVHAAATERLPVIPPHLRAGAPR